MDEAIQLDEHWEPLVDRFLFDRLDGATHRLHPPTRREVVFQATAPWENCVAGCFNVVRDDDRILLYYRGAIPLDKPKGDTKDDQITCVAFSGDGVHFERPTLGLYEFDGSRDNNLIWRGIQSHNFCVFRDGNPACPPEARFKAVGGHPRKWPATEPSLYGLVSPDGVRWKLVQESPLDTPGHFDTVNVAFWDSRIARYSLFSRYLEEPEPDRKVRAIQSCESEDFINWTEPVPHQYEEGVPWEHLYTNATTPCPGAEQILLSFPMRFAPERTRGTEGMDYPARGVSDAVMMSSRDGAHWDRSFLEAWLRPGLDPRNWTHRSQTPAVGIIETGPEEWSMYVSENYGWDTNCLRRVTLAPLRFASVHADYAEGELLTCPLTFAGRRLRVNYATSAVGGVRVDVLRPDGSLVDGLADGDVLFGDELDAPVPLDLSSVAGTPVRLRFRLKDADLFALRFGD